MFKLSDDSVELRGVLERSANHLRRRDRLNLLSFLNEKKSVLSHLPGNVVLEMVLRDELLQISWVRDHEHLGCICKLEVLVRALGRPRDLVADGVCELVDEELIRQQRHILLRVEDLLITALHEVSLQAHWYFDVDVVV